MLAMLAMLVKTKVMVAFGSAVLLSGSATGVGFAADGAAPGDTLYGLDCALERVGLGDGGLQERLQEATKLSARGESQQALAHAAEAVANYAGENLGNGEANAALLAAANAVQTTNQGESEQIRARIAEMLQWMATTQAADAGFGAGVAQRATGISEEAAAGAAELNRNGQLEQEQNQNGGQDEGQDQEAEKNQNGELNQSQKNQPEGAGK